MKIDPEKLTFERINIAHAWASITARAIKEAEIDARSGNHAPDKTAKIIGQLIADFNQSVQNLIGKDD